MVTKINTILPKKNKKTIIEWNRNVIFPTILFFDKDEELQYAKTKKFRKGEKSDVEINEFDETFVELDFDDGTFCMSVKKTLFDVPICYIDENDNIVNNNIPKWIK